MKIWSAVRCDNSASSLFSLFAFRFSFLVCFLMLFSLEFGFCFLRFERGMKARAEGSKGGREEGRQGAREQGNKGAREQKRKGEGSKGATKLGS